MRQEWIIDIIKQFVIANQIRTTECNILLLYDYFIKQEYFVSLGLVCDALLYDSKTLEILTS